MSTLQLISYIAIPAVFVIGIAILALYYYLSNRDDKIDYSKKDILYGVQHDDGSDYIHVPYLFWQKGKLKEIENRFADTIIIDNKEYQLDMPYKGQTHIRTENDIFPDKLYRDYVSKISRVIPNKNNNGNISETNIRGNNNQVIIQQSSNIHITNEIEKFLNKARGLSQEDRTYIESFMYKLSRDNIKKPDAEKAIDIFNKFVPFTTAIINFIKALF